MLLEKPCHMKSNINFRDQAWNRRPAKCWVKELFYPISIMLKICIEDSGNFKHPKNVKSINNTTVSHLVRCRVIPKPTTMKKREKEVF